ncbi:MAG: cation-translocating P-type ATPase [Opitutaceae bacterium]|nr:cation-translocating P-type ATPase [Cytophagales bacterium]
MKIPYPFQNPQTLSVEEVLNTFQTDGTQGLSKAEAEKRKAEFGSNAYQVKKQKSIWKLFIQQFQSLIVYFLAAFIPVPLYFKDYPEAIAIVVVILINAAIGFFMEMQARNSMKALREMDVILSRVLRDGNLIEIPSEQITPGDIVLLEAGDIVPGDGRIIESNQLQCDESSLTGESLPTDKKIDIVSSDASLGDRHNMVFKGASVLNGNGKAVITGISKNTELGTITSLVESSTENSTPLDKKLNELSKKLIWVTVAMTVVFAISGIIQGKDWVLIVETSLALAVAAIPEGLPIVATVALAYGMLLMAKDNAIVKKLSSVETLGSTNVILTDKTGTLTENKIFVETLSFPEEKLDVSISGNTLKFHNGEIEKSHDNFDKLRLIGALCNNASITKEGEKDKTTGDPIEIALIHLTNSSGISINEIKNKFSRIAEEPFSSETKIMATLNKSPEGHFAAAKGSVEHIVEKCTKILSGSTVSDLTDETRNKIISESEQMAEGGLRVLAFGFRDDQELNKENYLQDLVYAGMIGFLDPPRLEIKDAIASCRKAGIKVVMITGDHPKTALNIAKKVGLVDQDESNVITGKDIPKIDDLNDDWKKKILNTAVFARTTPQQKLDIAHIYQQQGNIVAMTGDGINDAPALKKADVGIAMGLRGTQVAKETASIVLKDDSFTSIAKAVSYGREIFQNIQKFVIYLISCNLSEILVVTTLGFIAPSSTLLPLQILFLNMVTDVFPALALGVGKGDKTIMEKPPRDPKMRMITNKNWIEIAFYSLALTLTVVAAEFYCSWTITEDPQVGNNVAFITLAFSQLFHVFNMASPKANIFVNEITKNKYIWFSLILCTILLVVVYFIPALKEVLYLTNLNYRIWLICISFSFLPLVLIQIYKGIWGRKVMV